LARRRSRARQCLRMSTRRSSSR